MNLITDHVASANDTSEFRWTFNHHTSAIPIFILLLPNINENPRRNSIVQMMENVSLGPLKSSLFALLKLVALLECLNDIMKYGFLVVEYFSRLGFQFLENHLVFMNPIHHKLQMN